MTNPLDSLPRIAKKARKARKKLQVSKKHQIEDSSVPAGGFSGANSATMRSNQKSRWSSLWQKLPGTQKIAPDSIY